MTYKDAANTLLTWREHIKGCRTCSHGIGYTCSRCSWGEDLEAAAEKAAKFLKGKKREVRKKPVVIEAHQWFKNGDHPDDYTIHKHGYENGELRLFTGAECKASGWEGAVVRYYRRPDVLGTTVCKHCAQTMHNHGWIDTLEGGHIVCPGDWVITGVKGERYPCKKEIFEMTYEPANA